LGGSGGGSSWEKAGVKKREGAKEGGDRG
jgi:hypothetical protein